MAADKKYRLDKSVFKIKSFEEASNNYAYWSKKSPEDRLRAANYLIASAYGFPVDQWPRMEKRFTGARKRD